MQDAIYRALSKGHSNAQQFIEKMENGASAATLKTEGYSSSISKNIEELEVSFTNGYLNSKGSAKT